MQIEYLSESMILMRAIDNRPAPVLAAQPECAEPLAARRYPRLFVVGECQRWLPIVQYSADSICSSIPC
jgi:hypothetical protein